MLATAGAAGGEVSCSALSPISEYSPRKLYVSYFGGDPDSQELLRYFSMFGEIEQGPLWLSNHTRSCILIYKSIESAKAAAANDPHKIHRLRGAFEMRCRRPINVPALSKKLNGLGFQIPGSAPPGFGSSLAAGLKPTLGHDLTVLLLAQGNFGQVFRMLGLPLTCGPAVSKIVRALMATDDEEQVVNTDVVCESGGSAMPEQGWHGTVETGGGGTCHTEGYMGRHMPNGSIGDNARSTFEDATVEHTQEPEDSETDYVMVNQNHEVPSDGSCPVTPSPDHTTNRHQKVSTGDSIAKARREMTVASREKYKKRDTSCSCGAPFSIRVCMEEIKKHNDIPMAKRLKATRELQHKNWRETFMCMDEEMRRAWLESLE